MCEFSGSRIVTFGRADGHADGQKLRVAFRNFANSPKKIKKNMKVVSRRQVMGGETK
jgi:hypothetical protein